MTACADVTVGDRVIVAFHPLWLDGRPDAGRARERPATRATVGSSSTSVSRRRRRSRHRPTSPTSRPPRCRAPASRRGARCGSGGVAQATWSSRWAPAASRCSWCSWRRPTARRSCSRRRRTTSSTIGKSLGADHLVNYRTTPEWHAIVREITDGRGADLVVDVGGADTLGKAVLATRMGGYVAIVGVLSGVGSAEVPVSTR